MTMIVNVFTILSFFRVNIPIIPIKKTLTDVVAGKVVKFMVNGGKIQRTKA